MTASDARLPLPDEPPLMTCPHCYPQRPMVIKNVQTSFRGKSLKVVFECSVCGATSEMSPPGAVPTDANED